MPFCFIGGIKNDIFCIGCVSKMPFCCIGGARKCIIWYTYTYTYIFVLNCISINIQKYTWHFLSSKSYKDDGLGSSAYI